MRETEYRAWDKLKKVMWKSENIATIDFESKCLWIKQKLRCGHWVYFDNAEIMQYTGLKDINDTKIFEGDIVKCFYPERNGITHTLLGPVDFIDGCYFITEPKRSYYSLLYSEFASIEVIGNIHQHKHLLEDKQQ